MVSLYVRGMTTREIQGHLRELYSVGLISVVTDAVLARIGHARERVPDAGSVTVWR